MNECVSACAIVVNATTLLCNDFILHPRGKKDAGHKARQPLQLSHYDIGKTAFVNNFALQALRGAVYNCGAYSIGRRALLLGI